MSLNTTASLITILGLIWFIVSKLYGFRKREVINRDIACRVLSHKIGKKCSTTVKIACSGNAEILRDIKINYPLRYPALIDGFLAYVHIGAGYLLCDMGGLTTILGTEHYKFEPPMVHLWKVPKLIKYTVSILIGVWWLYLVLLATATVVGFFWPLCSGPYGGFSLGSIGSSLKVFDRNGKAVQLPIVLQRGEMELNIRYRIGLYAKGFNVDTPYKYLNKYPRRTFRPPKAGEFSWRARGGISISTGGDWSQLKASIGRTVIRGVSISTGGRWSRLKADVGRTVIFGIGSE